MSNIPTFFVIPFGELHIKSGICTADINTPELFNALDFAENRLEFNPEPSDDEFYDPDHCMWYDADDLPLAGNTLDFSELTIFEVEL